MPIQGFTRLRSHQIGKQTVIGTAVAATRVMPFRGAIVVAPNRAYPDVDTGSLDPNFAPFAGAKNVSSTWTGKQDFNDLPYIFSAAGKGGVTPTGGGAAKTWTYAYASLTADSFDYFTDEWGDDTNATDGIQAKGGVIDSYTLGYGDQLEAWDLSANWIYADAALATAKTGALTVDPSPTWLYGANNFVWSDSVAGSLGITEWPDTVHAAAYSWNNNLDRKRFSNGSNAAFALSGYGRGPREITLTLTVAKTAATIAERATLDDDPVPTRFIRTKVTSGVFVTGSTPYSWQRSGAYNLISAADGEIGGNTTIVFTYRAVYNSVLTYAVQDVVVNGLAAL